LIDVPAASASSPRASVIVSPSHGLTAAQSVTITGKGFPPPGSGTKVTWFVTQRTAAVHGYLNASTDTATCDVTNAKAVHMGKNGTFTAHYRVETGIVGDGYCSTAGRLDCVIGIGTVHKLGTVVKITFRSPPPYPGSTPGARSTPSTSTPSTPTT
jgi:hypothetical protein